MGQYKFIHKLAKNLQTFIVNKLLNLAYEEVTSIDETEQDKDKNSMFFYIR